MLGQEGLPYLVVCHGMALSAAEFAILEEALRGRFRVLLWDMPGHGASGPLGAVETLEDVADALVGLLDHLGIAQAAVLGFSFGGMVAQAFHRRVPHRIEAMILFGCFAPYLQKPLVPISLAGPVTWLLFGMKPWPKLRYDFAKACSSNADWLPIGEALVERLGRQGFMSMERILLRSFRPDPDFSIQVPLLLLKGAQDVNGAALVTSFERLRAVAHQASEVVIPHAGHSAHVDAPEAFSAAVREFLLKLW